MPPSTWTAKGWLCRVHSGFAKQRFSLKTFQVVHEIHMYIYIYIHIINQIRYVTYLSLMKTKFNEPEKSSVKICWLHIVSTNIAAHMYILSHLAIAPPYGGYSRTVNLKVFVAQNKHISIEKKLKPPPIASSCSQKVAELQEVCKGWKKQALASTRIF